MLLVFHAIEIGVLCLIITFYTAIYIHLSVHKCHTVAFVIIRLMCDDMLVKQRQIIFPLDKVQSDTKLQDGAIKQDIKVLEEGCI